MDSQFSLHLGSATKPVDSATKPADSATKPTDSATEPAPALVSSLAEVAAASPLARKILVARTRGEGRELLRSLARWGVGWIGFEPTTLRTVAVECVGVGLATESVRTLDDYAVTARIDEAIDEVLGSRPGRFQDLSEAVGFRRALAQAVLDLRMAGLSPEIVRRTPFDDREKREIVARVLELYERALARGREVDTAEILGRATAVVLDPAAQTPFGDSKILLVPGLSARGRAGSFVDALRERGARFLADDRVLGVEPPPGVFAGMAAPATRGSFLADPATAPTGDGSAQLETEVFAATTVTAELREVLRRVTERQIPWDSVEILTPDPRTYGSALHALSESLGVPVTFGVGLPVERSRPGRALVEYFRWIDSGYSAEVIRGLLEAGDLRPGPEFDEVSPMELARRFRELRIGWGRARHVRRLGRRIAGLARMEPTRHESVEQMERRRDRTSRELNGLSSILSPVLSALPKGAPDPSESPRPGTVSPAELAVGASEFLKHVPPRDSVDETALAALREVLQRVSETWHRPTAYRAAAAIVRRALQIQVPAPRRDGRAPWGSTPGHLYFTDLEFAGLSNRPHTYIVGMDAGRFPGSGVQDPLLLDREREKLSPADLATSSGLLKERAFTFNRALARMRGSVTVSYATWEPSEARELSPSVEALAVLRLLRRDETLTFEGMRKIVGRPVGAIPRERQALDGRDVWLGAIEEGGRLLDGRHLVDALFPGIARGSVALAAPTQEEPSSFLGMVRGRPELDPRAQPDMVLSASRLEHLGSCPRRYLYSSVLRLYPPDDPDYKPDRWLSALARGDVLHRVFEATLRRGREDPDSPLESHALSALARELKRAADLYPTPSREIQQREQRELEEDVHSFLRLIEQRGAPWTELELKFGFDDTDPATIELQPTGSVRLRGAIDRLDATSADAPMVVIDYKTGSAYNADGDTGVFHGGRRLQNVLYTMAVHDLLGRPVARMEYQFATRRARNSVLEFTADELRSGPFVLGRMIEGAASGHFLPTDDASDCTWCDFRSVCRVREERGSIVSPPAEWTKKWMGRSKDDPNALPEELKALRDVRREEGPAILPPPLWHPGT